MERGTNSKARSLHRRRFALKEEGGMVQRVAYGLLFAVLVYVCVLLGRDADPGTRILWLRYWTFTATAVFAVAVPHVLLPDPAVPLLQRLNRPPRRLLVHQARAWGRVVLVFAVPGLVLAFFDPGGFGEDLAAKSLHGAANLLVVLGAGCYSFGRYVQIGPVSQAWQEGTRGRAWRYVAAHSTVPLGLPNGLVPAVTATGQVFGTGVLCLLVAIYAGAKGPPALALLPGLLLLGGSVGRLLYRTATYDRAFYATNAFYSEIFRRAGRVRVSDREPIPYHAVYWVPRRWKPSVWAGLRQLDRKLPLGRFIALGHGLLWILFFQQASMQAVGVYLLLFMVAKNGGAFLLTTRSFAPFPFQHTLQSPPLWIATRFLVNVRWTLPFLLSLLLVALFDADFSYAEALRWTGLDVILAGLTAWIVTYGTEFRYRKRFA
ncbi:MAG: hypothetical protein ACE5G0_22415 [Rhodothermales bacterium]